MRGPWEATKRVGAEGFVLKQESAGRAGGLKNTCGQTDRQTDSAVTHKVESTTNSTGGCSVSYFMDECTVGFGDRATLRPPATALLHPGIKETGEHTSPFGQRPPERLSLPPQALCFLTPDNWGNTMAALLRSSLRR